MIELLITALGIAVDLFDGADSPADTSISQDGSANGHGNPGDTNGHGNRPMDGQGNTAGRDIQGGANNKTIYS